MGFRGSRVQIPPSRLTQLSTGPYTCASPPRSLSAAIVVCGQPIVDMALASLPAVQPTRLWCRVLSTGIDAVKRAPFTRHHWRMEGRAVGATSHSAALFLLRRAPDLVEPVEDDA